MAGPRRCPSPASPPAPAAAPRAVRGSLCPRSPTVTATTAGPPQFVAPQPRSPTLPTSGPSAAAPSPSSGAKSPQPGPGGPSSAPSSSSSCPSGRTLPSVPVAPPALTGRVCGMGLPARLFLEMEGVFISSRFLRENIAARGWGVRGAPGGASLPAPLLPRRPHSLEPTVRTARVTPPYFLIGSAGEPETGKSQNVQRGREAGRKGGSWPPPRGRLGLGARTTGGISEGFCCAAPHGGAEGPREGRAPPGTGAVGVGSRCTGLGAPGRAGGSGRPPVGCSWFDLPGSAQPSSSCPPGPPPQPPAPPVCVRPPH